MPTLSLPRHNVLRRAVRGLAFAVTPIVAITTLPFLTGTASATTTVGSCLGAGHTLAGGQQLVSPNGQYRTVMQGDGNLVLYTASGHVLWDSRTNGHSGARTVLQGTDGNLVIYASNNAVLWSASTNTHPGDRLCMQSDANLVVYSSSNAALWATMTNHAAKWGQTLTYNPGAAGNCTYWAEYEFHWYTGTYINTLATSGTTGDAKYWAINASRRGWTVGSTPRMDSIAVWTGGSAGHVAWVTGVWPSQNKIRVSEMNEYGRLGQVDSRVITPAFGVSGLQYIYVNPRP